MRAMSNVNRMRTQSTALPTMTTIEHSDNKSAALVRKPGAYIHKSEAGFAIMRRKPDGQEVRCTCRHESEALAWSEAANRISIRELADNAGFDSKMDFLEECCSDSVVPACCQHGCETEPDGYCEHGCPSVLIVAGMI